MSSWLKANIDTFPTSCGVYLMKDAQDRVIYIGKAKNLRDRLRSYASGADDRGFVRRLDTILEDVEWILTNNEKEALLLENSLIKRHKPQFNIRLTDGSHYLSLCLTTTHPYPRLVITRTIRKDGNRYFGPFHSAHAIRQTVALVNKYFKLRTCSDAVLENRQRPCLQYQMKRCPAPCVFEINQAAYQHQVRQVIALLEGKHSHLIEILQQQMQQQSDNEQFEAALKTRNMLQALNQSFEKQRIFHSDMKNRDVFGYYTKQNHVEIFILRVRQGHTIGVQQYHFIDNFLSYDDILSALVQRFYENQQDLPDEILLPEQIQWAAALTSIFLDKTGHNVKIITPQRGPKRQLIALANRNAQSTYVRRLTHSNNKQSLITLLHQQLNLKNIPERIECFDISHFQSEHIVASKVCFDMGQPNKSLYRRYKIRSTKIQNDFQSMYEAVTRRLRQGLTDGDLPNLIIVDGGKGQLGSAAQALCDHGLEHIDLIALAKQRDGKPERIFSQNNPKAIPIEPSSDAFRLITHARDEAHRFAISLQRQRVRHSRRQSVLDNIKGIGPKRRALLLKTFGSVQRIKTADREKIAAVVGPKLAIIIQKELATTDPS